jgi:hypothetical protein
MLSRLDGPTVLGLANQAKSSGGVVNYNGVEFSYNELRDRLERDEDQELNREAHRMAIAQGRMDMAEQFAVNLARSLTREQSEAAIANGGVWNGIQLPQDVLQNIYQNHMQTARSQAEQVATTLPSAIALRTGIDELNRIRAIRQRTKNMFGGTGIPGVDTYTTNSTDALRQLTQAVQEGAPPEVITALTQRLAQNSQAMEQALDQALIRQAGGNKEAAGYMKSFVMGTPLDNAAAVQALTYFAVRGSQPEGIAMSPESKQVFQQAQRLVQQFRSEDPKIPLDRLRQRVAQELGNYAARTVGQARYERVSRDLPSIAQRVNHPFGKMDQNLWRQARAAAAATAYAGVARTLDISPAEVRQMRTTGKPLSDSEQHKALFQRFRQEVANFNTLEQAALVEELDQLPQVTPGRRNSSSLIDFLSSPELQRAADTYTAATGSESFGDYLVNPLATGALESIIGQEADGFRLVQADATRDQRAAARQAAAGYGFNPYRRSMIILSGIEGVGEEGARALAPFIRQVSERATQESLDTVRLGETMNNLMIRQENMVLNALQSTKFEDPAMEAYRKVAIRGWGNVATQADGFFITLVKTLSGQGQDY